MEDQVVVLDCWVSFYAMRVKIALAEKGIEYESKEENLIKKGPLLLEMNPVYQKVPVLIHNGKPICESLIIIQYIDEVWNQKPLLPSDPYQRSQARFWADYIDKKIFSIGRYIWKHKGEEQEAAIKDLIEGLKTMEGVLGDKLFFGGESLGFLDVALVPLTCWFYCYETFGNFSLEAECPKIISWAKRCNEIESVSRSLADPQEIYNFALQINKKIGLKLKVGKN